MKKIIAVVSLVLIFTFGAALACGNVWELDGTVLACTGELDGNYEVFVLTDSGNVYSYFSDTVHSGRIHLVFDGDTITDAICYSDLEGPFTMGS